jgi:predicted AAA+ superfamily ATPase
MIESPLSRQIAPSLQKALKNTPVVCLLGPRRAGKTTLARGFEPGRAYFSFDDPTVLNAAREDPTGFVQGLPDRVTLDEVQRVPELMPAIKLAIDRQGKPGRFLLTGSANLQLLPGVQETLGGLVEVLNVYGFTEKEKQSGNKSLLERLLAGDINPGVAGDQTAIEGVAEVVCEGGYPESIVRKPARAGQWHRQYLKSIMQRDVKDIASVRDEGDLFRLMGMLACRTAHLLNVSRFAAELGMRRETIEKYLSVLERLFLIRRLPAWHGNQTNRLVKTPKVHVMDSGLAASLSGLKAGLWHDHGTSFDPLLKSFAVQQLICEASWVDRGLKFSHYRDKDQVEVDLVIERGPHVWGVEVKKAASIHARDGAGLSRLAAQSGSEFKGGIVLYCGSNTLPLAHAKCLAVPMDELWQRD